MTLIDLHSRFPEAFILRDGSSAEIISKLRSVFARFGFPDYVKSDNGTAFISQEFEQFLNSLGIRHVLAPVYYPQANSCIERFHSTLKSRIKRIRQVQKIPLQQALDEVLFDVRSSPNDMNGETPFYRLFGKEMSSKLSRIAVSSNGKVVGRRRMARTEYAGRRSVRKSHEPGQSVLVRKLAKEPYRWKGKVLRKVGNYCYEVEINGRSNVYNQANLKHAGICVDDRAYERADDAYDDVDVGPLRADALPAELSPSRFHRPPECPAPTLPRRSARFRKPPDRLIY